MPSPHKTLCLRISQRPHSNNNNSRSSRHNNPNRVQYKPCVSVKTSRRWLNPRPGRESASHLRVQTLFNLFHHHLSPRPRCNTPCLLHTPSSLRRTCRAMLSLPPAITILRETSPLPASRRPTRWALHPPLRVFKISVLSLSHPTVPRRQIHRAQTARLVRVNVPSRIARHSARSANVEISASYHSTLLSFFHRMSDMRIFTPLGTLKH